MRIAILTQGSTGYLDAALRASHALGDEIMVVTPASNPDTGFDGTGMYDYADLVAWTSEPDRHDLVARVDAFDPDVAVMVSWTRPRAYREVMKTRAERTLRVLLMDNVWLATPKQWVGRATHRRYLEPLFDCVMVPGDRTEFFARRLGFAPEDVIRGCWSADTATFGADPVDGPTLAARRTFLSVGRLVEHKGADVLAEAYCRYRGRVDTPWDLGVVGTGPLASSFAGLAGVTMHGFRQPAEVAGLMRRASCFVLPSRAEPYGVVIHEAATAALPMLCTDFAGAVPMFLQDGSNGWTVAAGNPDELAAALQRMSAAPPHRLAEMSRISHALSSRITSTSWARHVHEEFERRLEQPLPVRRTTRRIHEPIA